MMDQRLCSLDLTDYLVLKARCDCFDGGNVYFCSFKTVNNVFLYLFVCFGASNCLFDCLLSFKVFSCGFFGGWGGGGGEFLMVGKIFYKSRNPVYIFLVFFIVQHAGPEKKLRGPLLE